MESKRIIGKYGGIEKGPLLIGIAGMHGNEPAGVKALETTFQLLEREPIVNPGFSFIGSFIGLVGNLNAFNKGKRFIEKDLNRQWHPSNVNHIRNAKAAKLAPEDLEIKELISVIDHAIEEFQPERIILLDLHTTSAKGGIFSIATDKPESIRIAVELHAPVILGMLKGITGTTLHYFADENFQVPTIAVAFEAGHHENPISVKRSISAIINCMRTIGCVRKEDVENHHDEMLIEYSKGLPRIAELLTVHTIADEDGFKMKPGYKNFQQVYKNEILGEDKRGQVLSPYDGLILMPLYQPQGKEGFFIIRDTEETKMLLPAEK